MAPVMRELAIRATQRFPEARITLSALLPRTDVPFHVIHGNNVELSRSCALIPNVHLVHHKDIRPHHMYDHVHLNKQGVKVFARVMKSTALGNAPGNSRNSNNKRSPHPTRSPHPPTESRPPSQHKSYVAAVQRPQNPAAAELNQIRCLLNTVCSRLMIKVTHIYIHIHAHTLQTNLFIKYFKISCWNIQGLHSSTFGNKSADQDLLSSVTDMDICIFHETWCRSNEALHCPIGYK